MWPSSTLVPLRFVCDCLAVAPPAAATERLRAAVVARTVGWPAVIDLANRHALSPALWCAVRDRGILAAVPPAIRNFLADRQPAGERHVAVYLEDQYLANQARNDDLAAQARAAIAALNRIGIEPLLLKGAALLLSDAAIGQFRAMRDIDLLVPPEAMTEAAAALGGIGYVPDLVDWFEGHHHQPPLYLPGHQGSIELHAEPVGVLAAAALSAATAWQAAGRVEDHGLRFRRLPLEYHLLVNLLHAAIVDRHYRRGALALRDLHEFAWLAQRAAIAVEWSLLREPLAGAGMMPVFDAYLELAHRLLGLPRPAGWVAGRGAALHYHRCRANLLVPSPLRRIGRLADQAVAGFSPLVMASRYGGSGRGSSLWAARHRHLRLVLKTHRGRIWRRLAGGT